METDPVVPEKAMEQVVRRLLLLYFKPSNQKTVVFLDKGNIRKSWLPRISGVQFKLIDSNDSRFRYQHHFEFEFSVNELEETSKGKYEIGFGFGCPCSGYDGDLWHFVVKNERLVSLKKLDYGYGSSGYDTGPSSSPRDEQY